MNEPTQALQPLTLSPKAEAVVKPKPTKNEIIDALVEIRLQQIHKENRDRQERRAKLSDRIRPAFVRHARDNALKLKPSVNLGSKHGTSPPYGLEVEFRFAYSELPEDTRKILDEFYSLDVVNKYCGNNSDVRKQIRKEIVESMESKQPRAERVQAMLNDKETRASLETILDNLTGKTINATATP